LDEEASRSGQVRVDFGADDGSARVALFDRLLPERAITFSGKTTRSSFLQGFSTGATGLEPATSGVTGLFLRYDDWRRVTRNRSLHAALRAAPADLCTIA